MKYNRIVVWFRNDLRLSDNETLVRAIQQGKEVVPVYCVDPRMFVNTKLSLPKSGTFRTKFLLESLADLRASFQKLGAEVVLLQGKPEEVLLPFAKQIEAKAIFFSKEVTSEERAVDKAVENLAFAQGIASESFWQSTLYHKDDLPFPIRQTPEVFTQFRKEVEKQSKIRPTFPIPTQIPYPGAALIPDPGALPTLTSYGLENPKREEHSGLEVSGGETAAHGQLQSYFWEKDLL